MPQTDMDRTSANLIQMKMRSAERQDADDIAHLVNLAFRPERFFVDADRTDPNQVRAFLRKGKFLLAEDSQGLAGCVYVEVQAERGYFGLLAVDPSRQRAGFGSRLIAAAEHHCRDAGCRFMDLTIVNLRTELLPYYRRFGYVEDGTLPFPADQHPPNQPCHLIRMTKPLV